MISDKLTLAFAALVSHNARAATVSAAHNAVLAFLVDARHVSCRRPPSAAGCSAATSRHHFWIDGIHIGRVGQFRHKLGTRHWWQGGYN